MGKIRVTIDRDSCISDFACVAVCPDVFEMADDGKSAITEQYRVGGDLGVGEVPDDLEDCVNQAVDICPVKIIKAEKVGG